MLKCALEVGPVEEGTSCFLPIRPVKSGLSEAVSIKIAATEIAPFFISPFRMKPLLVLQRLGSKTVCADAKQLEV